MSRSRTLPAGPDQVWRLVSDPYNLPRWYPDTTRVESVEGDAGRRRSRFTQVLTTSAGTPVRTDFRVTESTEGERLVWEQQVEGTPFEKFLQAAELELAIAPDGAGSVVTLVARRRLRGVSKLGSPMMRQATRRSLDAALDGIEGALGGAEA